MWYHSNETDLNPAFPVGEEEVVKEVMAHFWLERFCYMCDIAEFLARRLHLTSPW